MNDKVDEWQWQRDGIHIYFYRYAKLIHRNWIDFFDLPLFLLLWIAITDDDTTDWTVDLSKKKFSSSGAARQMYGSSAQRRQTTQKPFLSRHASRNHGSSYLDTTNEPPYHLYDDNSPDQNSEQFSHGRLITEPLHPMPPPFDASYRVIGGVRVPGIGLDSDIYGSRSMGERHDSVDEWRPWDRYGTLHFSQSIVMAILKLISFFQVIMRTSAIQLAFSRTIL